MSSNLIWVCEDIGLSFWRIHIHNRWGIFRLLLWSGWNVTCTRKQTSARMYLTVELVFLAPISYFSQNYDIGTPTLARNVYTSQQTYPAELDCKTRFQVKRCFIERLNKFTSNTTSIASKARLHIFYCVSTFWHYLISWWGMKAK